MMDGQNVKSDQPDYADHHDDCLLGLIIMVLKNKDCCSCSEGLPALASSHSK